VSATGTAFAIEQQWNEAEPVGWLQWATGDTVCVTFDAVPGARLDSVSVMLRRPGSIAGAVYKYSGTQNPTPLGQRLSAPLTASTVMDTPVPYPVPYPNVSTIDLRSQNIPGDNPLALAFVTGADPTSPALVVALAPTSDPVHSYIYSTSFDPAGWYIVTSNDAGDTMYVYPWRAYYSYVSTDVPAVVTLAPRAFTLAQNYPNPFNPSTRLEFTLATAGPATLRIYNALGETVATLFEGRAEAGRVYAVTFDGSDLPSGVYFARLEAGRRAAARKLVLLK